MNFYSNDKNRLPFEMNLSLVSQYMGFNIEWEHFYNMKEKSRIYTHSATHSQMDLLYFNHKCGISTSSVRSFHTIVNLGHVLKKTKVPWWQWRQSRGGLSLKIPLYLTPLRQDKPLCSLFFPSYFLFLKSFYQLKACLKYKNKLVLILLNSYVSLGTSILI